MCRICSRRSGVVLMGHPVGMDTKPTSEVVAVPTSHPTTRRLGAGSSLCLLRRVRLHNIAPLSDVGPPRRIRESRLGHRFVHLPPTHSPFPAGRCGQLRHRHDDLSQVIS